MNQAGRLITRKQHRQACELLEELDRRYPRRVEVLSELVNAYYELNDIRSYQLALQRLLPLVPDDPEVTLALAGSCMANMRPALALHSFRRFLHHWPDDPRAGEVCNTVAVLEDQLDIALSEAGLTGEDRFEVGVLHEQIQCLLEQGKYDRVCEVARRLLRRRPDFLPAMNNMGDAHFRSGRQDEAIAAARRVLELEPNNHHALSNLTRYLCVQGRLEEAEAAAERLKAAESECDDLWVKKAEALSFLGDDQGVLDAYRAAEEDANRGHHPHETLLDHLAAVAAMRLGREADARGYWNRALKRHPGFELAEANLKDLKQPVGKRHAPWAYHLHYWIPKELVQKLALELDRAECHGTEEAVTRAIRRFLEKHPQVAALVPLLLDRGDPVGRELAVRIAILAETPELLAALKNFAFSQRGPDGLRQRAAEALRKAGALPAGPTRLWIKGKWHNVLLFGFEIHEEPVRVHPPQVEELACEATLALKKGDALKAESLLRQALEIEPHAPDLLNNLATAYQVQGRDEEWKGLIRELHERDPDYLFGRVNMSLLHVRARNLDQAKEMLRPLLERNRFHITEFTSLCHGHVELSLAEGNVDAARSWVKMWKEVDPDHPALRHWRYRLLLRLLPRLIK